MNIISKGIKLIPKNYKKKLWFLSVLQATKFILEVFSIGSVIPIIYILAKGQENFIEVIQNSKLSHLIPEFIFNQH